MTTSKYYGFPRSLGKWVARLPRIWRIFYDKEENCIEAMSDFCTQQVDEMKANHSAHHRDQTLGP